MQARLDRMEARRNDGQYGASRLQALQEDSDAEAQRAFLIRWSHVSARPCKAPAVAPNYWLNTEYAQFDRTAL